jgi:N-acetylglucosamine kinase-like BadF-type ATPase
MLFLGVDGGQSGTTALVGDQAGRVLGAGSAGPCNHAGAAGGARKLAAAVTECVARACAQAGLEARTARYEAACFGMSGGPEDKRAILAEILPAGRLIVTTDADIALAGATAGEPGMVTIAGTGAIALGRNASGMAARAGGWGHVFGDEGGAFDIARQALRAVLRHAEGWGTATALEGVLLEAAGAPSANAVLHLFYTDAWPRPRVAALAKLVDRAAAEGDAVAGEILREAARQLAALTTNVRRRLWSPGEAVRMAYVGGVFRSAILLAHYRKLVEGEAGSSPQPPRYSPAAGALLEAYAAAGLRPALAGLPDSVKMV